MSKLDLNDELDNEMYKVINKLEENGYKREDEFCIKMQSKIGDIYIAFFPKLLQYDNKTIPWICCQFEVEDTNEEELTSVCKQIVKEFEEIDLKPFMDEDAYCQHFTKKDNKEWTKLQMYVNIDFPNGEWHNHTL